MEDEEHIIPTGPFRGRRIVSAPTAHVDMFIDIAEDFMKRIFVLDPGDYMISDESTLRDFMPLEEDLGIDVKKQIGEYYDIRLDRLTSDRLADIFLAIHRRTYGP